MANSVGRHLNWARFASLLTLSWCDALEHILIRVLNLKKHSQCLGLGTTSYKNSIYDMPYSSCMHNS